MILHHLALSVVDIEESKKFYNSILLPLGYSLISSSRTILVYDKQGDTELLLYKSDQKLSQKTHQLYQPDFHHIALCASSSKQVDVIHSAIKRLFGKTLVLSPPQNYADYPGSRYYAVFLLDPSNLKIEIMYQE